MRYHKKNVSIWITWNQWIPWVDSNGRIQYYILWMNHDFYLFQNSGGTYLLHLEEEKLETIAKELKIEGEVVDIRWKERQYGSHSWYALALPDDGKDWFHTGRRTKIQKILSKIQASVEFGCSTTKSVMRGNMTDFTLISYPHPAIPLQ